MKAPADCEGDDLVLFAPKDQRGDLQIADNVVEALAPAPQIVKQAANRRAIAAFEMLLVHKIEERVGDQALVVEQVLEHFAHVRAG